MRKIFVITFLFCALNCFTQQDIRELLVNYDSNLVLECYVEGNFTGSGYEEVIAFFQSKSSANSGLKEIHFSYCFVIADGTIINTYELPGCIGGYYNQWFNLRNIDLCSPKNTVFWMGENYGWVDDINENGIDEIYLYLLSGISFSPAFFEFDKKENQFKLILNYGPFDDPMLILKRFDKKRRMFIFETFTDPSEIVSYQWNELRNMYEKM